MFVFALNCMFYVVVYYLQVQAQNIVFITNITEEKCQIWSVYTNDR